MNRRSGTGRRAVILVALALLLAAPAASAQDVGIALGDAPRIADAGLELGLFASGLDFPMGMVELPDGSLLVATSMPDGGTFFQSTGALVRLTDEDDDGAADDAGTPLATGLVGPLVALQRADKLVFVTSSRYGDERISVFRGGDDWTAPLRPVGEIAFAMGGAEHQSYGLAVRPSPERDGAYELVFNVGAFGNLQLAGEAVQVSGLTSGVIEDASVYMVTVIDTGDAVEVSAPLLVARGLRNASALVFDPATGDLVIGENGIDTPEDRIVSLSADEINVIPADQVGVDVFDFGFPTSYVDYATGEPVRPDGEPPVVAFTPLDGSESEGIAALAVATLEPVTG
jgi:glucose/arabinose dehydrogenase